MQEHAQKIPVAEGGKRRYYHHLSRRWNICNKR